MTYESVHWHPNYVEYGSGLRPGRTWPTVQEQYRRPHALYDLRYADLPEDRYQAKLYYRLPRLETPAYRATFRDKPHTVARHYPGPDPRGQPPGFHGRQYYEDGPPAFKCDGPRRDKLFWLERPPYLPTFSGQRQSVHAEGRTMDTMRGLNSGPASSSSGRLSGQVHMRTTPQSFFQQQREADAATGEMGGTQSSTKRITHDGVGYL